MISLAWHLLLGLQICVIKPFQLYWEHGIILKMYEKIIVYENIYVYTKKNDPWK